MRVTCPVWRLPMVGTNATRRPARCQPRTCSRTAAIVVTVSMWISGAGSEAVFGRGVLTLLHRPHIALQRLEIVVCPVHEVTHEARLAPGGDVEHVVGDEDLAVGVGAGADPDDRHVELPGDRLAECRRDAFEQYDVGPGGFQASRLIQQPRGRLALAPLH